MQARCLTNFVTQDRSGVRGEMITVNDQETMDDLVKSGYVETVGTQNQAAATQETTQPKTATRKRSE